MLISILSSKIHDARVTGTRIDYVGSITLDKAMIEEAKLVVHQKVLIANITNSQRFETYVIEGGPGVCELNGAAAKLASVGDRVIIMAFAQIEAAHAKDHKPTIVQVNEQNSVI